MQTLFINIKELLQVREHPKEKVSGDAMKHLPKIDHAYLLIDDQIIADFGPMINCPTLPNARIIDASDRVILPTWVDSHTHIVFAGNRIQEFVDRIKGLSYEEIAGRGGGIIKSANLLNETSEDELYEQSKVRLLEIMQQGTGAVEIKSGYGLTVEGELKMLRVIQRLKANYPIEIKATFLGAHAFPLEYKTNHSGYLKLLIN